VRSARDIARAVAAREITAESVTRESLGVIDRDNARLNAFTQVFHDFALAQARRVDADIASGKPAGPLAGVPIALKDNICLAHGKTTCASRLLEHYHSPFDATAARKLIDAGAVIVGKDQPRRIRDGLEHGALDLRPDAQPARPVARARRKLGRFRRRRRRRDGAHRYRLRHRRLDPPARGVLRPGRREADLWTRVALRSGRVRVEPRPDRPAGARLRRRGAGS
jgi:hypothetical protein